MFSPYDTQHSSALTNISACVCSHSREVYAYGTQWSTSRLKCAQMTLGISMFNKIVLLHTKL